MLRYLNTELSRLIIKKQSALILGPRQVGKTTIVKEYLHKGIDYMEFPLQDPSIRLQFESDPSKLIKQVKAKTGKPLVYIDEAQKVPALFDAVQLLIDEKNASFILTGSSARKLKRAGVNLLPGRVKKFRLDPLMFGELGLLKGSEIPELKTNNINNETGVKVQDLMVYGALPGIVLSDEDDRADFLKSYSETYLEEEIRAEALSRKIGAFSKFLELAAAESGTSPNFTKLSQQSGVSQPAIKEYFNLLEDTLIVERVDPYLASARKRLLSSSKYYFFDTGVRNALARLPLVPELVNAQKGILFEHVVFLEIIRRLRVLSSNARVNYWRTSSGLEVDCVLDLKEKIIPIEIKSASSVNLSEIKGLVSFIEEYKDKCDKGFVITLGGVKERLSEKIISVPWNEM
ncbi:MAG: ATP-binding protein [Candidatus Firestonebacteria bacterium]